MNVSQAIEGRRSIRKYRQASIPREQIEEILTAGMMAPSACNTRPWRFVVVQDPELIQKMAKAHRFGRHLAQAGQAIVVYSTPQEGVAQGFWPQDCGAAIQNMLLKAYDMGYGTCWCGLYPNERIIPAFVELLGESEDVPVAVIALGVADEEPSAKGFYDETKVEWR